MTKKILEQVDELIGGVDVLENAELWASRVIDETQSKSDGTECSETPAED